MPPATCCLLPKPLSPAPCPEASPWQCTAYAGSIKMSAWEQETAPRFLLTSLWKWQHSTFAAFCSLKVRGKPMSKVWDNMSVDTRSWCTPTIPGARIGVRLHLTLTEHLSGKPTPYTYAHSHTCIPHMHTHTPHMHTHTHSHMHTHTTPM